MIDFLKIPDEGKLKVDPEEKEKLYQLYLEVKEKFEKGDTLSLKDTKTVVNWYRIDREYKFQLVPKKKKAVSAKQKREDMILLMKKEIKGEEDTRQIEEFLKEYKPKKMSKPKMVIYLENEEHSPLEEIDFKFSIEQYKGVKLNSTKLGKLLNKELETGLNEIEKKR